MVFVRVREDERLDFVEAALQVAEVRQDQVHAGLVRVGEQHAAVDEEQPSAVLEDRHVAADLAEAAERDDAQAVTRQGGGRGEVGVRVAHSLTPPAVRSSASWCLSASVAASSGSLTAPPGRPSRSSAALVITAPWLRNSPS